MPPNKLEITQELTIDTVLWDLRWPLVVFPFYRTDNSPSVHSLLSMFFKDKNFGEYPLICKPLWLSSLSQTLVFKIKFFGSYFDLAEGLKLFLKHRLYKILILYFKTWPLFIEFLIEKCFLHLFINLLTAANASCLLWWATFPHGVKSFLPKN